MTPSLPSVAVRLPAALVAALAGVSCAEPIATPAVESSQPITHGTLDDGDLGVVGLMDNGAIYCTGTMVSARVAVTAGHCIAVGPPEAAVFGPSILEGQLVPVIDSRSAADFDLLQLENDIGAVLLAEPAPAAAGTWPLWQLPFDDSLVGSEIRIVGFGKTENADDPAGLKREGYSTIASVAQTTFRFAPNPSQTCLGDSGGPAFLTSGDVEYLVGVASSGDEDCAEFADETRVDAYADDFLSPYVQATGEAAAGEGERCFYPENCAAGSCLEPISQTAFSYCGSPCESSDDCAAGMTCVEDPDAARFCRYSGAEPGAMEAPCEDRLDCATELCASGREGDELRCTIRCVPAEEGPCPAGYECREAASERGQFACFELRDGCSCRAGGAGGDRRAPLFPALLIALLFAALRRGKPG